MSDCDGNGNDNSDSGKVIMMVTLKNVIVMTVIVVLDHD